MDFFKKIRNFFSSLFHPFSEDVVSGIDIDSLLNDPDRKNRALTLLNENELKTEDISRNLNRLLKESSSLNIIENISSKSLVKIQSLCKQFVELNLVSETQTKKVSSIKDADSAIHAYYDNIPQAIRILKEHEVSQSKVQKNLSLLESESNELKLQSTSIKKMLSFFRWLLIVLSIISMLIAIILMTEVVINHKSIYMPGLISILIVVFVFMWSYFSRRSLTHEYKKNGIMQKRCTELLNKTKITYVHNQQVLDFQYKKYQVESSEMLELKYKNINTTRKSREIKRNVNNSLVGVLDDLEKELLTLGINNIDFVTRNAAYFSTNRGMDTYKQHIAKKINDYNSELKVLEHEKELLQTILN